MQPYIFTIKNRKSQSPLKIVNLAWNEEWGVLTREPEADA
jgi:hypothetical protein